VAKLLAVVALREPSLRLVGFNFNCCEAKAGWFKDSWDFNGLGRVIWNRGRLVDADPF
jgi:hypothetical protein